MYNHICPFYPMYDLNDLITPPEYLYNIWEKYPILTNMPEVWKIIPEEIIGSYRAKNYMISTYGRIYNLNRKRLSIPWLNNANYECINIGGHTCLIHRIVMITFAYIPNYKEMQVNHRDEIKTHNWVCNLERMTNMENIHYSINSGHTKISGENNYHCTITSEQADKIGYLIANSKMSYKEISELVGCSLSVVANLAFGNSWIEVYNKYNLSDICRNRRITNIENIHRICQYIGLNKQKISHGKRIEFYKEIAILYGLDPNNSGDIRFIEDLHYKKRSKEICNLYY